MSDTLNRVAQVLEERKGADAESSYVATGATVRVVEVQGSRVIVKEVA